LPAADESIKQSAGVNHAQSPGKPACSAVLGTKSSIPELACLQSFGIKDILLRELIDSEKE